MNKSFGGYHNKFFYLEAGAFLISIIWVASDLSQFYFLLWIMAMVLIVLFYSTRWFNEVVFLEDKVCIIIRQPQNSCVREVVYKDINRVLFKNYTYTSPANIKLEYIYDGSDYRVAFPYDYYKDDTKLLDFLKEKGTEVIVTGYGI